MRKLTLLLSVLLIWLVATLSFGKNGLIDYFRVNADVQAQKSKNARLKVRNEQLFAEIDDLNAGREAIEERARSELGMIKDNETYYRLVDENKKAKNSDDKYEEE